MLRLDDAPADVSACAPAEAEADAGCESLPVAFARTVLASISDAALVVDDGGMVRALNRAAERTFGWSSTELVGQPAALLVPPPDRRRRSDELPRVTAGGEPRASVGVRRDGSRFPMDVTVTPFLVRGERRAAWIVRDVTERAQLEAQLRQSQKMDAMGQLAGGIAHDFNNLLTVINGWCETLGAEEPAARRNAVEQIHAAAARAAALTSQLLSFGRKTDAAPTVVDLNVVIQDVAAMLERVIGETIALDVDLAPARQLVQVDVGQVGQVLVNLAVNARDAMPRGGRLVLSTLPFVVGAGDARRHGIDAGRYVRLRVADTGVGMPPDVVARAFEPFFTTKGDKGTGLGLATVHGIVRQAGGAITVESRPGEGTAFVILLPRASEEPAGALPQPGTDAREHGVETVLVVEDEPQVRAIAVNMLRARGYTVLVAGSADEAMAVAAARPDVALVVSDVVMPDESGPQLVARLRERRPELAALFVSGYAQASGLAGALDGDLFLQKPYTGRQLALRVRDVLDHRTTTPRDGREAPAS